MSAQALSPDAEKALLAEIHKVLHDKPAVRTEPGQEYAVRQAAVRFPAHYPADAQTEFIKEAVRQYRAKSTAVEPTLVETAQPVSNGHGKQLQSTAAVIAPHKATYATNGASVQHEKFVPSRSEIAAFYRHHIPSLRTDNKSTEWRCPCPIHDGTRDSFAIQAETGLWTCHSDCNRGGDLIDFQAAISNTSTTGKNFMSVKAEVYRIIGRPPEQSSNGGNGHTKKKLGKLEAAYDYVDESGTFLFQAVRFRDPKDFRQRTVASPGSPPPGLYSEHGWNWSLGKVRRVLYHLDEIASNPDSRVYIAEGEKDADQLRSVGFSPATTNPMGAGKWAESYSESLADRHIVLFHDSDAPGQEHAAKVAQSLLEHRCTVQLVHLPPGAKDVSEFLADGSRDKLLELIDATEPLTSETLAAWLEQLNPEPDSHTADEQNDEPDAHQKRRVRHPNEPELDRESLPPLSPGSLLHQPHTDTGNAERLIEKHGHNLRFCADMETWLAWDGRRWNTQNKRIVKAMAIQTMRQLYTDASAITDKELRQATEKHARKSESASGISNLLTQAECDRSIYVAATDLDQNRFLLNCRNGTIDLATGLFREHRREDLITKLVQFEYDPKAGCPLFFAFLNRIMGGGPDAGEAGLERAESLIRYLQKAFGYTLTGKVEDKAMFCFFGEGNNGKTTLLEVIRHTIFEYSTQILIEHLMTSAKTQSTIALSDMSDLRGARFVTTSEAEEGQKLACGTVKYLTGMGEIKAKRYFKDLITFPATHKLFLDANHKPIIRGGEKTIWNRLKPIPFTVTIPGDEIDKTLPDKLKLEAPGILAWMVEGCKLWQSEGLGDPPPDVAAAAEKWQEESDRFPVFLEDMCKVNPGTSDYIKVSQLWADYRSWCEENNEPLLQKTAFEQRLEAKGCKKGHDASGSNRVWKGIRYKMPAERQAEATQHVAAEAEHDPEETIQ